MTAHSDALTRLAGYYAAVSDKLNDDAVCLPPSDLTVEHLTVGDLGHAVAAMTFVRQVAREDSGIWFMTAPAQSGTIGIVVVARGGCD